MTDKPVPLDLVRFADMIAGSREFLRVWARDDGTVTCFINPKPIGPDPAALGAALGEVIRQGARAYARATGIGEDEATARIWQGLDAERTSPPDEPLELDRPVPYLPLKDIH